MQSNKTKSHCTQSITLKEGQIIWLTPLRSIGNKLKALEFNTVSTNQIPFSLVREEIKIKSYSIHSKKGYYDIHTLKNYNNQELLPLH